MIKYCGTAIVFQEVPDEISLAINITGCRHHCPDCHSRELWQDTGDELVPALPRLLDEARPYISCVCFMGGDHDQENLLTACSIVKSAGLKTCLYTGCDRVEDLDTKLLSNLDYLKIGRYIRDCGPLNKETTNQRMYR